MSKMDAQVRNSENKEIPAKKSGSKAKRALIWIAAALVFALSLYVVFLIFTPIGSLFNFMLVRKDAKTLDLTDSSITCLDGVWRCEQLESIEARGLELDADKMLKLREKMDNCEILWDVPIGGEYFESNVEGKITLPADTAREEISLLACLDKVTAIDALACPDTYAAEFAEVQKSLPDCVIDWNISIGNKFYRSTDTRITVDSYPEGQLTEYLSLFPSLEYVDASDCKDYDELIATSEALPQCEILWTVEAYGMEFKSTDTVLDMKRVQMGDIEELKEALTVLPKAEKVDMCGCGFTNEEMEQFCKELPDYKLVWELIIGDPDIREWTIRTDAISFSTLNNSGGEAFDENDFMPIFKYCTDLIALDLGHNHIKDISAVANLKNLRMLILADNHISDISPLVELPNLEYLEIFSNFIRDASPVCDMPAIVDLNIGNTYIADHSFLFDLPKTVRKVWVNLTYMRVSDEERNEIQRRNPECLFSYDENDPCAYIWCDSRWADAKYFINNWKYVESYNGWGDYTFKEGADLATFKPRRLAIEYAEEYTGQW